MKIKLVTLNVLMVLAFVLSACAPAATPTAQPTVEPTAVPTEVPTEVPTATTAPTEVPTDVPTEVPTPEPTAIVVPEDTLMSFIAENAPTLDGVADEAVWAGAQPLIIEVGDGANAFEEGLVEIRSVYKDDMVYFVVTWEDPTQSFVRSPWQKQEDGTWKKLNDPDDKGGDNNLYYEDKMALIWTIANSIPGFDQRGCFTACHDGENADVKPYGNKYTEAEGQMGDIWHWKSVRNLGQIDDQYLDHVQYSPETVEAGRHSDPKDGGGYVNNETEAKDMPAFMAPEGGSKDGAPGFLLDSEKVPFDDTLFVAGDLVPSIIIAPFTGDRGDISAAWFYADGKWTIEFSRKLVTDSEFDVQFEDLLGVYYFGLAVFDNAQVRHGYQAGANEFIFQQP